ncbi:MAG: DUF2384 domain-containing protein [Bacteroidota bacterium]|nr:DUF2384 domain-containing protein [Bacteroidota bacterium]
MKRQDIKTGWKKGFLGRANEELQSFVKILPVETLLKPDEITYEKMLGDKYLVAKAVKLGVPNSLFLEIQKNSPFSDEQWSVFLDINSRTLQRHRKTEGHVYKTSQSQRIFELAEIVALGDKVFDSREQFLSWLNAPSIALGREKPIDLLDNSFGKDLVIAELNRIEHGIFV